MPTFVRSHRRGKSMVKSYSRSSNVIKTLMGKSSLFKSKKQVQKIASAFHKRATASKSNSVVTRLKRSAKDYQSGVSIINAQIGVKKAVGRALLSKQSYSSYKRFADPVRATSKMLGGDTWRTRYRGPLREVRGPVSAYPRGSKLNYNAMIDPYGNYFSTRIVMKKKKKK